MIIFNMIYFVWYLEFVATIEHEKLLPKSKMEKVFRMLDSD